MTNATNKRRKAYAADLQAMGLQWVDSYTVLNPRTGETGTRYELEKGPSDVQMLQLARWWNVIISYGHHLHAPEIKRCSVVLLDRCPKHKPAGLQVYR